MRVRVYVSNAFGCGSMRAYVYVRECLSHWRVCVGLMYPMDLVCSRVCIYIASDIFYCYEALPLVINGRAYPASTRVCVNSAPVSNSTESKLESTKSETQCTDEYVRPYILSPLYGSRMFASAYNISADECACIPYMLCMGCAYVRECL